MFKFYENTSIWPCCLSLVCWDYYDYLSNLHPQVDDVMSIIFTGPEQLRATGNQLIKTFSIQSFFVAPHVWPPPMDTTNRSEQNVMLSNAESISKNSARRNSPLWQ